MIPCKRQCVCVCCLIVGGGLVTEISDDEIEFVSAATATGVSAALATDVEIGSAATATQVMGNDNYTVPRPTQRALEYSVATATDAGSREPRVPMCLAYVLDQCTSPPIPPDGQNKLKPKAKKRPLHWVCISSTIMQTTITILHVTHGIDISYDRKHHGLSRM